MLVNDGAAASPTASTTSASARTPVPGPRVPGGRRPAGRRASTSSSRAGCCGSAATTSTGRGGCGSASSRRRAGLGPRTRRGPACTAAGPGTVAGSDAARSGADLQLSPELLAIPIHVELLGRARSGGDVRGKPVGARRPPELSTSPCATATRSPGPTSTPTGPRRLRRPRRAQGADRRLPGPRRRRAADRRRIGIRQRLRAHRDWSRAAAGAAPPPRSTSTPTDVLDVFEGCEDTPAAAVPPAAGRHLRQRLRRAPRRRGLAGRRPAGPTSTPTAIRSWSAPGRACSRSTRRRGDGCEAIPAAPDPQRGAGRQPGDGRLRPRRRPRPVRGGRDGQHRCWSIARARLRARNPQAIGLPAPRAVGRLVRPRQRRPRRPRRPAARPLQAARLRAVRPGGRTGGRRAMPSTRSAHGPTPTTTARATRCSSGSPWEQGMAQRARPPAGRSRALARVRPRRPRAPAEIGARIEVTTPRRHADRVDRRERDLAALAGPLPRLLRSRRCHRRPTSRSPGPTAASRTSARWPPISCSASAADAGRLQRGLALGEGLPAADQRRRASSPRRSAAARRRRCRPRARATGGAGRRSHGRRAR